MLIHRLPGNLPALSAIVADICNPSPEQLAAALDVHPRTVTRWLSADVAPRAVCPAPWPLTRWGMSAADAELWTRAELDAARRLAAELDAEALRHELARVIACADFGAANDPTQSAAPAHLPRSTGADNWNTLRRSSSRSRRM